MKTSSVIGRASFVRGRVSGSGDLEIAGRVEGNVTVSGEVLVDTSGLIGGNVSAARIVVRGAVKGDLVAEEALHIEAGARVVGDLRAPRVAIAPGGLVRGHVQTGGAGAVRARAVTASARSTETSRAQEPKIRTAPAAASAASRPAARPASSANDTHTNRGAESVKTAPRGAILAGSRVGPPAPVVPVLKKGTKAVQKKHR